MKKRMAILLAALLTCSLAACGSKTEESSEIESTPSSSRTSATGEPVSEPSESALSDGEATVSEESAEEGSGTNRLVAYFSYAENAALPDGVDASASASIQIWNGETTGNTGVVAAMIAEAAGADLFSIQTVEKYPDFYDATIDQGQEEQRADARPQLAAHVENLDDYDVIFLGFPKLEQGFTRVYSV